MPARTGGDARGNPRGEARVVRPRLAATERLRRLWGYRELLVGMVRKELKVKYKNSTLGFAWSLVNPLLYLVVFYVAFQLILGAGIPAFPVFLLSGLLVWNLFSSGLAGATGSIVGNAGLVGKVAFPREILPLAAVGAALVHFFLQALVLLSVLVVVRWDIAWGYLWLVPVALVLILLLTAALGVLLAAVNVYLRDTQHFLELALLAWFWMTPVVYSFMTLNGRDEWWTRVWAANPVTPVVLAFQRALYAKVVVDEPMGDSVLSRVATAQILPDWPATTYLAYLGVTLAAGVVVSALALWTFGRLEANFAEEL